ncbi:MAG: hypothetical protein ACD_40C00176G0002, partial [uncultured bacterium]
MILGWWGWSQAYWGPRVVWQSKDPVYLLRSSGGSELTTYLDTIQFWDESGVADYANPGQRVVPRRVVYRLTDAPQEKDKLNGPGEVAGQRVLWRAWDAEVRGRIVYVTIYVNEAEIEEHNLEPSVIADEAILRASYLLKQVRVDYKDSALTDLYNNYTNKGVQFVRLAKRTGITKVWGVLFSQVEIARVR